VLEPIGNQLADQLILRHDGQGHRA
jgi:hypothetical protein